MNLERLQEIISFKQLANYDILASGAGDTWECICFWACDAESGVKKGIDQHRFKESSFFFQVIVYIMNDFKG